MNAQSACEYVGGTQSSGSNPTITISLSEANKTDLSKPDSEKAAYRAYIGLYGILNSNDAATGISVSLSALPSTPSVISFHPNNATFTLLQRELPSNSTVGGLNSGVFIEIQNPLDREGPTASPIDDVYRFDLLATCTPRAGSIIIYTLTVILGDVNDNAPQFSNSNYYLSVNELTPIGVSIVTDIAATDQDSGTNAQFDISIIPGLGGRVDGSQEFGLIQDGTRVYVVVKSTLEFESLTQGQTYYVLEIAAVDRPVDTNQRKTGTATLTVSILDNNDLDPEFLYTGCTTDNPLTIYTNKNDSKGQPQQAMESTNMERFTSAAVDITVEPSNDNAPILSIPFVGYIYENSLNETYITARETNTVEQRNVSMVMVVNIVDVNDNAPQFTPGTYVASVPAATDVDTGLRGRVMYEILRVSNNGLGKFAIVEISGNITVTSTVNAGDKYTIAVKATDLTLPDANRRSNIALVDVEVMSNGNNKAPATDPEGGVYILEYQAATGKIINNGVLDREALSQFTLAITVQDASGLSSTTTLYIAITDINDNAPVFQQSLYIFNVEEGKISEKVGTVKAQDDDTVKNINYKFKDGDFSKFSIGRLNGQIFLNLPLDYETKKLIVNDNSPVISVANAYISVLETEPGTNNSEVVWKVTNVTSNAGSRSKKDLFDIIPNTGQLIVRRPLYSDTDKATQYYATDPEGGVLYFRISNGNRLNFFNIGPNTGKIINNGVLDREALSQFTLAITVQDASGLSSTTTLYITITDINDNAPVFQQSLYIFNVEEGKISEKVGTVKAVDMDENSNGNIQTYSISPFSQSFNLFYINSVTGDIYTSRALDYESQRLHRLLVLASDQASDSRTGTTTVSIYVTDVSDAIPYFPKSSHDIFVPENIVQGTLLLTVTAQDDDTVKNINYKFKDGDFSKFSIGRLNGQIFLNLPLDYETKKLYEFSVTTFEGENASTLDVNDNPPVISVTNAYISVLETEPVSSVIAVLNARDNDQQGTNNSEVLWKVNVQAQDLGVPPLTAVKVLTVEVIRNKAPRFNSSSFLIHVNSSKEPSSSLFTYPATDDDQMAPHNWIMYNITGDDTALDYFTMQGNRLQLKRSPADNPSISVFTVRIRIQDNGSPTLYGDEEAIVTVNVIRGTNSGIFFMKTYYVQLNDIVDNNSATITYSMIGNNNGDQFFNIDINTGQIKTIRKLSTDTTSQFTLLVIASDGGSPPKTANTFVYIKIVRNFHAPEWIQTSFSVTLLDTHSLDDSLNVDLTSSVQDLDVGGNNKAVVFKLVGTGAAVKYFQINESGEISLKRSLQHDTSTNQYLLYITASDLGDPPKVSTGTATVKVTVLHNRAPVLTASTYSTSVNEDKPVGTVVSRLTATDPDVGVAQFGDLTFHLEGFDTASQYFQVNPSSGVLLIKDSLATSGVDQFQVLVRVSDNGKPPLYDEVIIKVRVVRNLYPPEFRQLNYSVTILESEPAGDPVGVTIKVLDRDQSAPNNKVKFTGTSIDDTVDGSSCIRYGNSITKSQQTATVAITVQRNRYSPKFKNLPSTNSIEYNNPLGVVYVVQASDDDPVLAVRVQDGGNPARESIEMLVFTNKYLFILNFVTFSIK
ncbi:hypothetical protein KUTeg_003901 [Tegillarca granosa]|uniref:Cadherin domain-containing protein n=1 Tax=Tegillarca granosa TaxID=220873 RepID=A0ABQ9FSX4_TEGGR|nr:hypothetical protein KUTeg_003901 [Tegillarca granosa]